MSSGDWTATSTATGPSSTLAVVGIQKLGLGYQFSENFDCSS